MKKLILGVCFTFVLLISQINAFAAPAGDIVLTNASNKTVTAQVISYGSFNLAANEHRNIPYSSLEQICSSNPTDCTARFYVDNKPIGSATINTVTGKLKNVNLSMKVRTGKSQNILRTVTIK